MVKEIAYLTAVRERIGRPSAQEARGFLDHTVPEIMQGAGEAMENKIAVHDSLKGFKQKMLDDLGSIPSQADLCSTYIATYVFPSYSQLAKEELQQNHLPEFRFFYDFSMGITEVTSKLYEAEEAKNGRVTTLFHQYREKAESVLDEGDLDTRADDFAAKKSSAEVAAKQFDEDSNGFALVDNVIEDLESDEDVISYSSRSKEYMAAGARFAAYLYKESYKIAEGLYPQDPPQITTG